MSVYATILHVQHTQDAREEKEAAGVLSLGDDSEARSLGSPWAFWGSHIIPEREGLRTGLVELAAISAFVEDARQGVPEAEYREGWLQWLRLSVGTESGLGSRPSIVVLDAAQAAKIRDTLDEWLASIEDGAQGRRL